MKRYTTPLVLLGFVAVVIAIDQYTASTVGAQELRFANQSNQLSDFHFPDNHSPISAEPYAKIYVTDPIKALEGTSPCRACNQLVRDLLTKYKCEQNGARIVGLTGDCFFQLCVAPKSIDSVPAVFYQYANGASSTYYGRIACDHREVVRRHPAYNGRHKIEAKPASWSKTKPRPFHKDELERLGNGAPSDSVSVTNTCWVQSRPVFSSNCSGSQSYFVPRSANCGNGGNGFGPAPGGGDYYTPPQSTAYYRVYPRPRYTRTYNVPRTYYQYHQQPSGVGNWVCGPNGCYRVR